MSGANQLGRLGVFHEKTAGSGSNRVHNVLVELKRRHDHEVCTSQQRLAHDLLRRPQTVAARHANVHEHDVGSLLADLLHRFRAGGGRTDDHDVGLGFE